MATPGVLRTVGKYEILGELGRGGMAVVYLARDTTLDRKVAIKELGAFHAADPAFAERFLRESQMAGSLNHDNIVTVYEYGAHENIPYIAMEYVERGSLRPLVGRLTLPQIAGALEGLLAGLAHAHSPARGTIVHRDLKPENLMVTGQGRSRSPTSGSRRRSTRRRAASSPLRGRRSARRRTWPRSRRWRRTSGRGRTCTPPA